MSMRDTIKQLIERRNGLWEESKPLWDLRTVTDGDVTRMELAATEIAAFDERIAELHELDEANRKAEANRSQYEKFVPANDRGSTMNERFSGQGYKNPYVRAETRQLSDEEVFWRDWVAGREPQNHIDLSFDGLEAHRTDKGEWEVRDLLTTSTTVATDVAKDLYRHIVSMNAVMGVANVDNFNHGRSVVYPASNVRGTAAIIGEGSAITEGDGAFTSVTLDSWKYAHLLQVTNELIEDVEFDLLDYIAFDAGRAIGKASGAHFATGSGTNAPRGVITAIANDLGTAVQVATATVESDNLIDLFYAVSAPYRAGAFWLMNDSTAKAIRKVKNADDSYVWSPGLNGAPDSILGRPVLIDPAVASIGSANLSVAFFNPNAYKIRTSPLRFERSNDFAFSTDMASFRAVARMDGDLLDATATVGALIDTD